MSIVRFGPRDLLQYEPKYRVLICRECRYAIQKSAIQSHLLRHKIYRGERQSLLAAIARFELLEPDDIALPEPGSSPFDALPVIPGYQCTAAGCSSLCASSKRMRRHWSQIHGVNELGDPSSFARPANLQTFFRGTKIRYFEVTTSSTTASLMGSEPVTTSTSDSDDVRQEVGDEKRHDRRPRHPVSKLRSPLPTETLLPKSSRDSSLADLDLETMTYFHHFLTKTSLTLPSVEHPRYATQYWQTDIVLLALQKQWLMYGLLAVSASHSATTTNNTATKLTHTERSYNFRAKFFTGEAVRDCALDAAQDEVKIASSHIIYILCCTSWSSASFKPQQNIVSGPTGISQTDSVVTIIRDILVPEFPMPFQDITCENLVDQANKLNQNRMPAILHDRLDALPGELALKLEKPGGTQGVRAVLSAVVTLVECCGLSFASDEPASAWWCMAMWLNKIPEEFNGLLMRESPAALVVLAHWAASLLKRAEYCGCWFLESSSKKVLLAIADRLPVEARGLVLELVT